MGWRAGASAVARRPRFPRRRADKRCGFFGGTDDAQIWATAVKASLRSAVLMWPGPPVMADGTKPTYWYPFVDRYHYRKKVQKVAGWLGAFVPLVRAASVLRARLLDRRTDGDCGPWHAQTWTTRTARTS